MIDLIMETTLICINNLGASSTADTLLTKEGDSMDRNT